jgi:lipopolysaccharide/colanic/teichoic acid biosynthesis glycosyltransferase
VLSGWRYRIVSASGAVALTLLAILIANHPLIQTAVTTHIPLFWRLDPIVYPYSSVSLQLTLWTSAAIVLVALVPLYKPHPWRTLDVLIFTQKRVVVAALGIAALGYFNYSFRLPRTTLAMTTGVLLIAIPLWFVTIRRRVHNGNHRAIIVGDDHQQMEHIVAESELSLLGYLCPPQAIRQPPIRVPTASETQQRVQAVTDDGPAVTGLTRLGGLSKLDDVLTKQDVDTVVLAFDTVDRGEFFGTLDQCHKHGVHARVHRRYADDVLTASENVETLVDVDLEPWDPQDYLFKRMFDIAFAWVGLVVLAPVILAIAVAVKLDSPGPVFYKQQRTTGFGEMFPVYKFRTMIPEGDSAEPVTDEENDRITRVGSLLRRTHLDEIPQLWAILGGQMSVVGPRAAWTHEEELLQQETDSWRKRWFVTPGLTGLAQINDAKSTEPDAKLRYDIQYIREQSFWFDLKIVIRQIWKVVTDMGTVVLDRPTETTE